MSVQNNSSNNCCNIFSLDHSDRPTTNIARAMQLVNTFAFKCEEQLKSCKPYSPVHAEIITRGPLCIHSMAGTVHDLTPITPHQYFEFNECKNTLNSMKNRQVIDRQCKFGSHNIPACKCSPSFLRDKAIYDLNYKNTSL